LTPEEAQLATDPYGREWQVYGRLADSLKSSLTSL